MEKQSPKICLLGASFGTSNMGVNALTAGTLKAFFEQYPSGELFLLDYGKEGATYNFQAGDRIIPVQLVNIRFSKKFYLKNNIALLIMFAMLARCIPLRRLRGKVISKNFWLSRIAEADSIVSMAGGDSFSDIYGIGRFMYVSLPQLLALFLGKRLVFLPQTIGPFDSTITKRIAKFIMHRASAIYSRDHTGLKETEDLLGSENSRGKVRFCYDVGFVLDPLKPLHMDLDSLPELGGGNSPIVGLNISGLLFMGGYSRNNMFGLKVDYRKLVVNVIEHLIQQKGATVLLVPHVFGAEGHAESDSAVCKRIYAELKQTYQNSLYCARGSYNQSEIKYIIGLCDFFIGSRMHACIAALSQHVPAVSIAYSKKFIGVLETVGMEDCVADPRVMEEHEIIRRIDEVFENRAAVKKRLEQIMPEVKARVQNLFNDICGTAREI
ncbi:MAG: polysaccharide pyruvyl transferase family protein [Nitrospirota bacterium]